MRDRKPWTMPAMVMVVVALAAIFITCFVGGIYFTMMNLEIHAEQDGFSASICGYEELYR